MKTPITFATLMALTVMVGAQTKEIVTTAEIKSVTIYNSSAEIHYQKDVALPQGKSTLVFTELTPFIVDNTINISASSPDVDIISVTERINYAKERQETNNVIIQLHDSISLSNSKLGLLKCRLDALTMEKNLLFKGESIGGVSEGVAVSEIEKASAFFSKRYLDLATEIYHLSVKELMLQSSIKKYNNQINELTSDSLKASSEISVIVINTSAKKVTFNFKFLTAKGGWAPVYDCKYQGAKLPLKFVFRANVFNASGIPWDNVDIKLSTANPTHGFDAPTLNSQDKNGAANKEEERDGIQFKEIAVYNTIAEYDIKFKYSIPSDAKPYLIDVNAYEIEAEYNYLLIPIIDPFGFLMAKIPNWNKYNLIPGTTNIYNKGSYMGKTFLNTYAENDTLSLYLGKDNNIQAIRKENNTNNRNNLIGNFYVDKAAIDITIKSNAAEKLRIQVLDQVPTFDDNEKVKFSIEQIDQALYNKEDGLLTWNFDLAENASTVIEYKYDIKVPKMDVGGYRPPHRRARAITCPSF